MEYDFFLDYKEINLFTPVFVKSNTMFNIRQILLHFSFLCNESYLYNLVFFLVDSHFFAPVSIHVYLLTTKRMEAVCASDKPTLGTIVFSTGRD